AGMGFERAWELQSSAADSCERLFGARDWRAISTRWNANATLAAVAGREAEGISRQRELCRETERLLGPDDARAIGMRLGLASILSTVGESDEAITIAVAAAEDMKRVTVEESAGRSMAMSTLASVLERAPNRARDAIAVRREAIRWTQKYMGPDSSAALVDRVTIIPCLMRCGGADELAEAAEHSRFLLERDLRTVPAGSEAIRRDEARLARILLLLGGHADESLVMAKHASEEADAIDLQYGHAEMLVDPFL